MTQYYYLDNQNRQCGPVYPTQFTALGVTAQTRVWCPGMANWQPAGEIPELAPYILPSPGYVPGSPYMSSPDRSQCPPTNLVWAILTTILCCLPLGIVSIVYASQVDSEWMRGNYENARRKSLLARNWAIASAVTSFVLGGLYFIIVMCGVLTGIY